MKDLIKMVMDTLFVMEIVMIMTLQFILEPKKSVMKKIMTVTEH